MFPTMSIINMHAAKYESINLHAAKYESHVFISFHDLSLLPGLGSLRVNGTSCLACFVWGIKYD
jgi:hypothetical protein